MRALPDVQARRCERRNLGTRIDPRPELARRARAPRSQQVIPTLLDQILQIPRAVAEQSPNVATAEKRCLSLFSLFCAGRAFSSPCYAISSGRDTALRLLAAQRDANGCRTKLRGPRPCSSSLSAQFRSAPLPALFATPLSKSVADTPPSARRKVRSRKVKKLMRLPDSSVGGVIVFQSIASPLENRSTYWTATFDASDPTTKNAPAETARARARSSLLTLRASRSQAIRKSCDSYLWKGQPWPRVLTRRPCSPVHPLNGAALFSTSPRIKSTLARYQRPGAPPGSSACPSPVDRRGSNGSVRPRFRGQTSSDEGQSRARAREIGNLSP